MSSAPFASLTPDELLTLDSALDAQRMQHAFTGLVRAHLGEHTEVGKVVIEVLRRRNQRCVIRYRVEVCELHQQRRFDWRVIGKVYIAHRGEGVFQSMQQLWNHGFSRDATDSISIPEPLGFSSSLCMLFQEEVPGLPVKTVLEQSPKPVFLRQLARTIAKLHQCPVILDKPWTVQEHLRRCHPSHTFLSLACPELAIRIDYIVETSAHIEATWNTKICTPMHGDFHLGQVHLDNGHAWLFDFDALGYGDPAADLGNVLVFLKSKAREIPNISALIEAFEDEYFSIMDRKIAARIPLYEALTHLRRACKCLRLQQEGWQHRATRMVNQGVVCLDSLGTRG